MNTLADPKMNWYNITPCNVLAHEMPSYLIEIFSNLITDEIHTFKWVKTIRIWQNGSQLFEICRLMSRQIFNMFNIWYFDVLIEMQKTII